MSDQYPMVITLKDVYDAVTGLRQDLHSMQTAQDLQAQAVKGDHERVEDHEVRIRFLERWAWSIPAAFVTAIVSAIVTVVLAVI
jgi:hypothetical protein